jgi:F1F0 ATPase subunit 2
MEPLRVATAFGILGTLLGAGYFAALRLNVERYLFGRSTGSAVALHLGRLLLAAVAFALIAQAGALALLGALVGFLLSRFIMLRRLRI